MQQPLGSDPLAERARVSARRPAIVRASDGRTWSYGDLDAAVEEAAGRLAALGIGAGDHVALLADTGVPAVRTIYAALRVGAVPVLLNARLTAAELAPQLDRADAVALVCEPAVASTAAAAAEAASEEVPVAATSLDDPASDLAGAAAVGTDEDAATVDHDLDAIEPAAFDAPVPDAEDLRLLLFTSGTTGEPKAVELTAGTLRASALASALRLGTVPGDRWFVPLSIYHMGGFAPVYRSVLYGTTAVLQRDFDAERTLAAIDERDATCLSVVPTMLQRLLDVAEDGAADAAAVGDADGVAGRDALADLRFVLSGGAATPPDLVDRCAVRDVALFPTYGVTEAASQVATATPTEAREHEGTVGHPLLPTTVRVVDPDGQPVPRGETGEVVVDGPTVSPGYYGDPEATAASRSSLGYHTGDLGFRDEAGRLRVLGRVDDRIVTGGENVHAAEVETALREHPAVEDAVVLGLDDPEWGERVAALVAADAPLAPRAVREHCDDRLADYKQPRTVAVVEELPRTPSGTVDRELARERLVADGEDV